MATVDISHLSFSYPTDDGATPLTLSDASVTFPTGEFSLLTGPSGSGKSTLMKLISGLYPQFAGKILSGHIKINHQEVGQITEAERSRLVTMMFQNPNEQFAMDTVENELIFALENQQVEPNEMMPRIDQALAYVEIESLRHRQLSSLSGGEKQKVALAVIVVMNADTILLDEPFASVDPEARQLLLNKLSQLQREQGKTIIISDHDLEDYQPIISHLYTLDGDGSHLQRLSNDAAAARLNDFRRQKTQHVQFQLPSDTDEPLIEAHKLEITAGPRTLISQPTLKFYKGRMTLLTGPNGTGKSTLLSAISKLHAYQGQLEVNHKEVRKIRSKSLYHALGMVFQDANQQFLNVTVAEELALSQKNSQQPDYFKRRLPELLDRLDLSDLQTQVVYSLSGGQKKKMQILEMLMMATPLLLFDEPFTGLDYASLQQVMAVMKQVATDCNQTFVIVSHQLFGLDQLIDFHLKLSQQQLTYVEGLA